MSPEEANLYRWGGGDGQLPPIERAALHALNQGSWEHGGRIRTLDLPITSRFHAVHWIPPSVALLRCANPGQAEGQPPLDQIAKTSSSNATATRRLVGS
jgi:hypothetical protein